MPLSDAALAVLEAVRPLSGGEGRSGKHTVTEISTLMGVSRATVYAYVGEAVEKR